MPLPSDPTTRAPDASSNTQARPGLAGQSDEAALLTALRAGDEDAFRELVDAWSPGMLRVARAFVSGAASAEDVVQDAWLGVLKGLATFEGRSSLRSWAFTIVVNRARTRGAHEARTVASSQIGLEQDTGPTVDPSRFQGPDGEYPGHWTSAGAPQPWNTSPEHSALSAEAMTVIEGAVDRLPPRQRLVVTLRDIQGMTSEEACAALEITAQNQRVLLHRARAALRDSLEEYYRC